MKCWGYGTLLRRHHHGRRVLRREAEMELTLRYHDKTRLLTGYSLLVNSNVSVSLVELNHTLLSESSGLSGSSISTGTSFCCAWRKRIGSSKVFCVEGLVVTRDRLVLLDPPPAACSTVGGRRRLRLRCSPSSFGAVPRVRAPCMRSGPRRLGRAS